MFRLLNIWRVTLQTHAVTRGIHFCLILTTLGMWWQVPLTPHPPGFIYESALSGSWIMSCWQTGNHANLTGACLQRFVVSASEAFILGQFVICFQTAFLLGKRNRICGRRYEFLGTKEIFILLFRWGLLAGALRTVWSWRWRHCTIRNVDKFLPVCTAAVSAFRGPSVFIRFCLCLRPPYNLPLKLWSFAEYGWCSYTAW
jgi:hypothetical protein